MAKGDQRMLTPPLRFPEFREPWTTVPLADLAESISDRVGSEPCVPYTVTSGVGLVSQDQKLGRTIAGKSLKNYIRLKRDDFAYNKSATKSFPEGYIARYRDDSNAAVPNSIFTCFRADARKINPAYLDFLFASNLHGRWLRRFLTIGARAHGSLNVSDDDLMAMPVPMPTGAASPAEQKKIAECLTSLDELIAAQGRKVEALKAHKKGLMQQLFPREGETLPRLRFPEFQDSSEWTTHAFEEFVAKSFYGTSHSTSPQGQYPVLRMGNMVGGGLDFTNLVYLDLDLEDFKSIQLQKGDVLLNRTNSLDLVGKISIFTQDLDCITASYIVTFRLHKDRLIPAFCNALLNTPLCKARIKLLARPSVSQANINPTTFRKELQISVPSVAEQQRIADCLSALDAQITAEANKLAALKTHKQGLMRQLFPSPEGD